MLYSQPRLTKKKSEDKRGLDSSAQKFYFKHTATLEGIEKFMYEIQTHIVVQSTQFCLEVLSGMDRTAKRGIHVESPWLAAATASDIIK